MHVTNTHTHSFCKSKIPSVNFTFNSNDCECECVMMVSCERVHLCLCLCVCITLSFVVKCAHFTRIPFILHTHIDIKVLLMSHRLVYVFLFICAKKNELQTREKNTTQNITTFAIWTKTKKKKEMKIGTISLNNNNEYKRISALFHHIHTAAADAFLLITAKKAFAVH